MIKKFVFCAAIGILLSNCAFAVCDCEITRESIKYYEQYSKENPGNVCVLYNLANEYYIRNKFQKALNTYNDIIDINPKEARAYKKRAEIYNMFNNYDNAEREYGRLVKNVPDSVYGNYHIAVVYENISDYDNALKFINKAIESSDKQDWASNYLFPARARILQKIGRYEEAIEDYTKFTTSENSFNYSYYWYIRECYEALGDKEKAKEADRKWQAGLYRTKHKASLIHKIKLNYSHFKNKFYNDILY